MRGFKFEEFDALCADLDADQLQLKWQHYTRALSAASSSTAVATLAAGPTGGVSMIGAIIAGPLMHNARKKRQIIEKHMAALDVTPETRKKDIYGPALISGFLGGATAGIGLGAEALAVDKATKIIGHVVADGIMTKVEDAHAAKAHAKEIREHEEGQLIRTESMPAVVSALAVPKSREFTDAILKHTRSMPGTLGATANGLMASAARMKAHNYPLLKEYISSVAVQSRNYMSRGQNSGDKSESSTVSVDDSITHAKSPAANSTLAITEPPASMPQNNGQLEGGSPYPQPIVSPLLSDASPTESEMDPGLVSPCETVFAAEPEADYAFNNLLTTMDEATLKDIERELEQAIEEMDNPEAFMNASAQNKRMSRTFEAPTDIDQIVRRQSTRYSKRISVRYNQHPASRSEGSLVESDDDSYTTYTPSRRRRRPDPVHEELFLELTDEPLSPATTTTTMTPYVETDPNAAPEAQMFSDEKECKRQNEEWMDEKQVVDDQYPSDYFSQSGQGSTSQRWEWHDEKQVVMDPAMKVRHPSLIQDDTWPSTPPPRYYGYYDYDGKEVMQAQAQAVGNAPHLRGGAPSYIDSSYASSSYASSSRYPMSSSGPSNSQQLIMHPDMARSNEPSYSESSLGPWRPPTSRSPSIAGSTTSVMSRTSAAAMKGHSSMKKVGYLGLEPAAKLAIGGSLLLMGVRPSAQRRMLDKAKAKMGMEKEKDDDDDYMDYI